MTGALGSAVLAPRANAETTPLELPPVGVHPTEVNYYSPIIYANALAHATRYWWVESTPPWGDSPTPTLTYGSTYLDASGNPIGVPNKPGTTTPDPLVAVVYRFHNSMEGRVVLTWTGSGDIRVTNATARQPDYPSGHASHANGATSASTGQLNNGRRAYTIPANSGLEVKVYAVDASNPPKNIRLWIPHPNANTTRSLEPSERVLVSLPAGDVELTLRTQAAGQLWHPDFLRALKQRDWGYLRTMTMTRTNNNAQVNWSDRRLPSALQQSGRMTGGTASQATGVAWEHLIALCNATDLDLWICVPHQATVSAGGYVEKLARLIRHGGKANGEPFDPSADLPSAKVYEGLESTLNVWVEYSNEVWNDKFSQYFYAVAQGGSAANAPKFVAERSARIWKIFEGVFSDQTSRIVRVLPTRAAGNDSWVNGVINRAMDPALTVDGQPAPRPDVVATANYFTYDIQTYVLLKVLGATNNPNRADGAPFYFYPADIATRMTDPANFTRAFDEFRARMIAGQAGGSLGIDAGDVPGGFSLLNRTLTASYGLPLISYEGGPSIYTESLDGGSTQDDYITTFMSRMNSDSRMAEMYRIHLNQGWERGLWSHMPFEMMGAWGKNGQWGHIEGYNLTSSVKWEAMKDWYDEALTLRHLDEPLNAVPQFDQASQLASLRINTPISPDFTTSGGNGQRTVEVISSSLMPGLTVAPVAGDPSRVRVTGTATKVGSNLLYLRVRDADGDPAWRTFRFDTRRYLTNSEAALAFDIDQVVLPGSSVSPARTADTATSTLVRYNLSTADTQPLFNIGNPATTPAFYGGLELSHPSALGSHNFRVHVNPSAWPNTKAVFVNSNADATTPLKMTMLTLWKKGQFTGVNSGQPVALNDTSELWVTLGAPGLGSTFSGMRLRFVLRNGTQYYLSEQVTTRGDISGTAEFFLNEFHNNSAEGKRWHAFNPTATNFLVPASLGTPTAVTFNDVTEVGFIAEGARTNGSMYPWQKFQLFIGNNALVNFNAAQVVFPNNGSWTTLTPDFVSNSTTVRRRNFSTATGQQLFNVGNPQTTPAFYGGLEITGPTNHGSYARVHNNASSWPNTPSAFVFAAGNSTTPAAVKYHVLFRKDQFQGNPGTSSVAFTSGARLAVTLGLLSGSSLGNTELRFVVKNGTQYYVSEYAYTASSGISGTVEVALEAFQNASAAGKRWHAFAPTASSFGIPTSLATPVAVNFTNVQEVGFILQGSRTNATTWPWQQFTVTGATW